MPPSPRKIVSKLRDRVRAPGEQRRGHDSEPKVYPEVVVERTHVGPLFDAFVARMKRNQEPLGLDADYDLLRENFDYHHFLLQAEALQQRPNEDPVRRYLHNGARASNSPNPNFSMKNYLERHPERNHKRQDQPYVEWLRHGRDAGEIADPAQGIELLSPVLGLSPAEIVDELVSTREDLVQRLRTGKLGEMFAKAVELEPLVGPAWNEVPRARLVPLGAKPVAESMAAIHACHEQADFRRARLVLVANQPGSRHVRELTHSLSIEMDPSDIVVIYTEVGGSAPANTLPPGTRELDFATVAERLDDDRFVTLVALLRSLQSEAILSLDSATLHGAMGSYGMALAASERIFFSYFPRARHAQGHWEGSSLRAFYPTFATIDGVLIDSEQVQDELTEHYQLSDADRSRIHLCPESVDPGLPVAAPPPDQGQRPVIAWVGPWDHQGRGDLVLEIARRLPEIDFRLWSVTDLDGVTLNDLPANAHVRNAPERFDDYGFGDLSAWLHTAVSGDVHGQLLDVAMTTVPIIGTTAPGVEELVGRDAELVSEVEQPDGYVQAIREVLADPKAARTRSRSLRERLVSERPRREYARRVVRLLLDLPPTRDAVDPEEETR